MIYNFTTDQFDFDERNNILSEEASTLNFGVGEVQPTYITIKNPKTGVEICFRLTENIIHGGEISGWRYKFFSMYNHTSTDKPVQKLTVNIWND